MKKFCNFILSAATVCGLVAGAYYVFKHYIQKDDDDFYDFEDDFNDFEMDDDDFEEVSPETREYVTLNPSDEKDMPPQDNFPKEDIDSAQPEYDFEYDEDTFDMD